MTTPTWEELPAELRARVDELVVEDRWLWAVRELRNSGRLPTMGLYECRDLVSKWRELLGDRIRKRPEPARDPATLIAKVQALPTRPDAFEALWDGDTTGWFVLLYAVTREPRSEVCLAGIRQGSDLRLFNGTVPPWPEAQEAVETGTALARHFGVPFFFLSPDSPDITDDQRWWDTV